MPIHVYERPTLTKVGSFTKLTGLIGGHVKDLLGLSRGNVAPRGASSHGVPFGWSARRRGPVDRDEVGRRGTLRDGIVGTDVGTRASVARSSQCRDSLACSDWFDVTTKARSSRQSLISG